MTNYHDVVKMIEASCGNGKDNVIALATIAKDLKDDFPHPYVREVDAFYEDGVFYVTTWGKSNKILQIAENPNVSLVVCQEGITCSAKGENLGWIMKEENAALRLKLRQAFSKWYDHANNEKDENCVILALRLSRVTIFRDEGATQHTIDMINHQII